MRLVEAQGGDYRLGFDRAVEGRSGGIGVIEFRLSLLEALGVDLFDAVVEDFEVVKLTDRAAGSPVE